jgi:hypothetical protein
MEETSHVCLCVVHPQWEKNEYFRMPSKYERTVRLCDGLSIGNARWGEIAAITESYLSGDLDKYLTSSSHVTECGCKVYTVGAPTHTVGIVVQFGEGIEDIRKYAVTMNTDSDMYQLLKKCHAKPRAEVDDRLVDWIKQRIAKEDHPSPSLQRCSKSFFICVS